MDSEIALNHFVLDVRRELDATMLLRTGWRADQVRPEFADLRCERCGKIDEWAALQRGLPAAVRVKQAIDFAYAGDGLLIVSARAADVLEEAAAGQVTFFPFQDSPFAVLWPLNVVAVAADSPLNRKQHPRKQLLALRETHCTACGRPGSVTVRPEFGKYTAGDKVVGLRAEGRTVRFMLICHNSVGDALQTAGISGWKQERIKPFTA